MRKYLFIALFLCGCASQQMIWVTSNPQKHNFDKERYACLQDSAKAAPATTGNGTDVFGDLSTYDLNANTRDQLFSACMQSKGWTLQPAKP